MSAVSTPPKPQEPATDETSSPGKVEASSPGKVVSADIALLPGDGIGPEVIAAARRVLDAVAASRGHVFHFHEAAVGGIAIDTEGSPLPAASIETCAAADAILLGAVGGPKWSDPSAPVRPEQGLLALRRHFGLFANLRPVRLFPALRHAAPLRPELLEGVDLLVVRELTGGLYFGERSEAGEDAEAPETAWDTLIYSRAEIERVARVAFEAARGRRKKVASIDKANVLASMRLWRRTVDAVAEDYPDVELEHVLVDAAAMRLLQAPASFDVVLAGNLFGDVLSDEASVLAGSLGMLPSASLGEPDAQGEDPPGLYEPVHGSAPDIAGQGKANPIAALLSAAMMLRHSLGLGAEAEAIEKAVARALDTGARTADLLPHGSAAKPISTEAMTERVLDALF